MSFGAPLRGASLCYIYNLCIFCVFMSKFQAYMKFGVDAGDLTGITRNLALY